MREPSGPRVRDPPGQRLVAAVFAPRLRDRLQLDVGRIATDLAKVILDRLHLGQRQVELPLPAQSHQAIVVERTQRDRDQLEAVARSQLQPIEGDRPNHDLLDGVVGQHVLAESLQPLGRQVRDPNLAQRAHGIDRYLEIRDRGQRALGHGVHHARLGQYVHDLPTAGVSIARVRERRTGPTGERRQSAQ